MVFTIGKNEKVGKHSPTFSFLEIHFLNLLRHLYRFFCFSEVPFLLPPVILYKESIYSINPLSFKNSSATSLGSSPLSAL